MKGLKVEYRVDEGTLQGDLKTRGQVFWLGTIKAYFGKNDYLLDTLICCPFIIIGDS